jgi:hypothetical protein
MDTQGHNKEIQGQKGQEKNVHQDSFVLEKSIFSNIFEKDIRRVYMYKKAERLAKAIHLVSPAFRTAPALKDKMDSIAVGLVDAAILPPSAARDSMSRELLALSSVLSIARTGGLLSVMNAELISREAHQLLQEIAAYEEPRLFLDDVPSLATLAKEVGADRLMGPTQAGINAGANALGTREVRSSATTRGRTQQKSGGTQSSPTSPKQNYSRTSSELQGQKQGQSTELIKDKNAERLEAIVSILKSKGPSYIKDISTLIREVSEKTIQRDLQNLIDSGYVQKTGERRWTTYSAI